MGREERGEGERGQEAKTPNFLGKAQALNPIGTFRTTSSAGACPSVVRGCCGRNLYSSHL